MKRRGRCGDVEAVGMGVPRAGLGLLSPGLRAWWGKAPKPVPSSFQRPAAQGSLARPGGLGGSQPRSSPPKAAWRPVGTAAYSLRRVPSMFQNSEARGKELKEICHSQWTGRHDAFEVLVDLLQALALCLDGINSDTNIRWNNCIVGRAFVLCSTVTDFDFIVTIVVLKNVLSFMRAFGKNLQGQTSDVFFAASSLTAVLHSLNEVMENIEVYHEFWFEEATNLGTELEVQMKLPGKFRRVQQSTLESQLTSESYYTDTLSVPMVEHIIQELKDIFSEQHLKALK
ncbi:52 kDa repressor of the inhibitor of the protein kinase [Lemmus lemmus]